MSAETAHRKTDCRFGILVLATPRERGTASRGALGAKFIFGRGGPRDRSLGGRTLIASKLKVKTWRQSSRAGRSAECPLAPTAHRCALVAHCYRTHIAVAHCCRTFQPPAAHFCCTLQLHTAIAYRCRTLLLHTAVAHCCCTLLPHTAAARHTLLPDTADAHRCRTLLLTLLSHTAAARRTLLPHTAASHCYRTLSPHATTTHHCRTLQAHATAAHCRHTTTAHCFRTLPLPPRTATCCVSPP
jgi:hypothetical protein